MKEDYLTALAFALSAEEILVNISPSRAAALVEHKEKILSCLSEVEREMRVSNANRRVKSWMKG